MIGAHLLAIGAQHHCGDQAEHRLPEVFPAGRQAARVFLDDLPVVIYPTDGAINDGDKQDRLHKAIAQIRPEKDADDYAKQQ